MNKIPKVQSGSPNLLSPNSYYLYYHQRAGLQDAQTTTHQPVSSKQERFNRVLSLYTEIAKKIAEDLRPQYINEVDKYNSFVRKLESRLDNKLRIAPDGSKYILVNGRLKFDGSDEAYEEHFKSGKIAFREFVKEVARELIATVKKEEAPLEDGKALITGGSGSISNEKPQETVAVDLDNTLVDQDESPIAGAKEAIRQLRDKGYRIAVYTARFSKTPKQEWQSLFAYIAGLLKKYDIPYDEISVTKPISKFYIDDRGIRFTNWKDVMSLIDSEELKEDGPQDMKPSELSKSKMGGQAGGVIGMREDAKLEVEVQENKSKSFKLLSQKEINEKVYSSIGNEPI